MNLRKLFLTHLAQTSDSPMMLEVEKAEGIYIYSPDGKQYIDLISGVSVSNVGHCHPKVVEAVKQQAERYMHLMVYGEYIQSPQVQLATALTAQLPSSLSSVYLVNSGSEANEAAMKLAKRSTGRTGIIAFKNAYHGSTQGPLSIIGDELFRRSFRPLLPEIRSLQFNNLSDLNSITEHTACVIVEPVQGEAGIATPNGGFLQQLRKRCTETGTLLVFDEVQTGFGRLGTLFAFQKYNVLPDMLTLAKAMGGGMPIGGLVASKELMNCFTSNPVLGHITTFGGHPVSAAAALASLETLIGDRLVEGVDDKGALFKRLLVHPKIKEVRGEGLFMAVELGDADLVQRFIRKAMDNGLLTDWFLFCPTAFRIAPPLTITNEQIQEAVTLIHTTLDEL